MSQPLTVTHHTLTSTKTIMSHAASHLHHSLTFHTCIQYMVPSHPTSHLHNAHPQLTVNTVHSPIHSANQHMPLPNFKDHGVCSDLSSLTTSTTNP